MNPPAKTLSPVEAGTVLLLTGVIFLLDLFTPSGWMDWMLYLIPLIITFRSPRERDPYLFAAVATVLIPVGGFFSPGASEPLAALLNRGVGIGMLWALTWLIVRQKHARAELAGAEAARTQAESHRQAAVAARELAEASAMGALHRESQTGRELLVTSLRLEDIIRSAMDAIVTVDEQQRIQLFNQAAEQMFRCPVRDAIGQPLDKFIPARFRDAHRRHVHTFGRSGVTSRRMGQLGTVVGLRADGEEFPIEAAISHITVEGRKYYTVIIRDITDRQQAEEALRRSESRLRDTLDHMLEGCQIIGFDWTYVYVNETAARQGRKPKADMVGRTITEVYPGIEKSPFYEVLRRCMEERTSCTAEIEFTFPDDSTGLFDISVLPAPEGILVLSFDITDRKRAEQLVRQSEERYRRLIAVSPYAILVNRGDRVIFANDQAIRLFGAVKAQEILDRPLLELFHPDCHALIREAVHTLLEGGQQMPVMEEEIVKVDGTSVDVEVSSARLADEEGPAIVVMLRDISDRKRLQEQLRRTERIAELGTLASGMAHEIGTPMNVILGRAEYLMERVTEEPIKRGLQTIVAQVERITRVMNQLLAFARRKPPERIPLDLKDVIENSLEMFRERLDRSRVQVELCLEDSCSKVQADADQISQVVINLVMNAIHAMPEGGRLRIELAPNEDRVTLTLSDTGHGIPRDAIRRVFEPFFTTKEFGKGTGLGLTVVKGIIEEHQGTITVESEEGKGTTFSIELPKSL